MMYEHFLLYWYLWILFIIVHFFMNDSMKRYALSWWILLIISTANLSVDVETIQISVALLVVLLGTIIYFIEHSFSFMKLFYAFTIMIGYCGILMWHQLAPIWFFLPIYIMIPILIVFLVLVLEQSVKESYATMLLGMTLGHMMYYFILITHYLTNQIGGIDFLTHSSLAILLLTLINGCFLLLEWLSNIVHRKLI